VVGLLEVGSAALTAVALASATLLRRKDRRGWWLTGAEQPAWMAYAIWTRQYGFIVSACWYFYESVRGVRGWKGSDVADTSSESDDAIITRVVATLPLRVAGALEYLVETGDGDSHADIVGKALAAFAFLRKQEAKGGELCIRHGDVVERVHLL
jgi:hypothetical protein